MGAYSGARAHQAKEGQAIVHRGRGPMLSGYPQLENKLAKIAICHDN
ncbi:hypothetical protein HMPREF9337_01766 [Cutibacterium acnes HL096PA3]|nr:hypothetical protein HMPREF0675_4590 [Cutibacterium acnes SK137]AEE72768.1 hypothetical protein PAZ_c16120 [Cutibacterium acnes 266]EFD01947.1 hypothetical protein HMPREF1034_0919 [Cutibacterium acnes SK187]EFD06326.1 hypothetical protein HMPREF9207_1061 [Cutibacterium acnes J165]EFS41976.1 hypothetical protein HMPREF9575_00247 [Cutibacterium acnes HL110PA1]EFS42590.1 hypothetical protein HMPREF9576_02224 [Cutibacterium acnes HL110PA2]EFS46462.1 hypothetical protein HMPREF9580_00877 [Cutib